MANDLSSLLTGGLVVEPQTAASRKQVLGILSTALGKRLKIDGRDILEAVLERESLGSTAVGEGVVVPHARVNGLERPVGGFLKLTEGVDFDAPDGATCDLIFMLLAPHVSGADHLRALAQVSRAFRSEDLREKLRATNDTGEMFRILCPQADMTVDAA
ncbi:MAG: PTS sugar transporter subunit IIA [Pseudomonadota bacterium]